MHRTLVQQRAPRVLAAGLFAAVLAGCGTATPSGNPGVSTSPTAAPSGQANAPGASTIDLSGVTLRVATYPVAIGSDETLLKAAGLLDTPYKVEFQTYPDGGTQTSAVLQGTADISRGSGVANALLAGGSTTPPKFRSVATLKISTATQWT